MTTTLHPAAAGGFTAGAGTYARGRPDYPPALLDWLRAALRLGAGTTVLDLGSGTGKLLPHLVGTGARVIAVEPVRAMLDQLAAGHPEVEARPGRAEAIPFPDGGADAVACAQSFHWFATPAALAEIRRVLRPGGRLGLVWNVRDEGVPWVAALTAIMAPHAGDAPRYHAQAWRSVFPAAGFGPLEERVFRYGHAGPPERVIVDRVLSVSFIAALPEAERARVAGQVRALIARTPDLAGRAEVTFPYRTTAFRCERTA
ncbi:putative methyltransferase [Methylobacterium crusticola]|uniref:Methyltransferase n=1 Tax=Methylobacterium crusticola TaxID=1697972 RepID=A0ABQ4R496_9HYPH|nr:class I SAM-dependent methyltransferase [Methylobacterium crusticola]GJD52262.1 putative methyltransferase [Methylobacterium crusticola]